MDYWLSLQSYIEPYLDDPKGTTIILGCSVGFIVISIWIKNYLKRRSYFSRINVPGPKPLPFIGNLNGLFKNGPIVNDAELIKKYGKICGYFEGSTPVILTTDLKLIKNVMIKDFSSFVNRRTLEAFESIHPFDKWLIVLKDDEWKNARSLITNTFTTGRIKLMSKGILKLIKNYEDHLEDLVEKDGYLDTRSFFGNYSVDVICSCFFGVDISSSIKEPNNEFQTNLDSIANCFMSFKFKLLFLAPGLTKFLNEHNLMHVFPMGPFKFFEKLVSSIISRRKEKLETREDFIQYMVEHEMDPSAAEKAAKEAEKSLPESEKPNENWSSKPLKKTLTNQEILAQAMLFLTAGNDTSTTTLDFIAYNIATHKEVQDKIIEEIDKVLEKHNGEINYDSVVEMKYLDMVIDESIRMYPSGLRLDRVASNDYEYEGIKFRKGEIITIPIYTLHHDPEIYPDPEEFKPERFSEENKKNRESVAFLGFGAGPRNCVGMRFAHINMKLLLSSILSKYRLVTCDKTPVCVKAFLIKFHFHTLTIEDIDMEF